MVDAHKTLVIEKKRGAIIVTPQGDAIGFRDMDIQNEFQSVCELLDDGERKNVVVDLGKAEYFGSIVIGWIIDLATRAKNQGGRIALCNVSGQMQEFLSVMHLEEQLPQFPTRRKALKAVDA